jgi:hypothetical protein
VFVDGRLQPVIAALDARADPVDCVLGNGNDDSGWDNRSVRLLDVVERHRLPMDTSGTPACLRSTSSTLQERWA